MSAFAQNRRQSSQRSSPPTSPTSPTSQNMSSYQVSSISPFPSGRSIPSSPNSNSISNLSYSRSGNFGPVNFNPDNFDPDEYDLMDQSLGPIDKRITIYSKSANIVERYVAGTSTIDLPKSVDISSILVVDQSTNVIPFTFIKESDMGMYLTDRETGEKNLAIVKKGGDVIEGKILYYNNDVVTVMTKDTIVNIREYDSISIKKEGDLTRPRIKIKEGTNSDFIVSYLVSDLSWNCIGTAIINNKNSTLYLRLAAHITNNTDADIKGVTQLVSGNVYENEKRLSRDTSMMYAKAQVSSSSEQQVVPTLLEDFHRYNIGNRDIKLQNIAEIGTYVFPINKIYIHDTESVSKVKYGYRFITKNFMPASNFHMYSIDKRNSVDSYLGSTYVEEAQIGKDIKLIMGETTRLQCKTTIETITKEITDNKMAFVAGVPQNMLKHLGGPEYKIYETKELLKVEIKNYATSPCNLIIRHFVGNKIISNTNCKTYKRDGNYIEWYFEIKPTEAGTPKEEEFVCQINTLTN